MRITTSASMGETSRPSSSLGLLLIILTCISLLKAQTQKIYLTSNQSALLIPELYIDQTIYTNYSIQGNSIKIHPPLQNVKQFVGQFVIATNSYGQSLIRMHFYPQKILSVIYYVSPDYNLHYVVSKTGNLTEQYVVSLKDFKYQQNQDSYKINNRTVSFCSLEIFSEDGLILWTNRSLILVKLTKQSPNNSNGQSLLHLSNYSSKILKQDLPVTLSKNLTQCHFFKDNQYICITNQQIILFQQIPAINIISIIHIFKPPPSLNLKCMVNVYRLEDDLIALCDCNQGCFNFYIDYDKNLLNVTANIQMLSLEEIVCMKITESAPKMATMVISGHTVLALMKWGQQSIQIADSMLLPVVAGGQIWDIEISGNNICLKYRIQSAEFTPTYQFSYIFIQYDGIRLQYDQLNIILNSSYIYPLYDIMYSVQNNIKSNEILRLRALNPYYIIVYYQPQNRNITIIAFNTDLDRCKHRKDHGHTIDRCRMENETIQIQIISVEEGKIYKKDQLISDIQINYQYTYPISLFQCFVGRINKFIITQKQLPIPSSSLPDQKSKLKNFVKKQQKNTTIYSYEDRKILSIYNLLQCLKLINSGPFAFLRVMTAVDSSRIYIEECKTQKQQNMGDFVCQIKQMADRLTKYDSANDQGQWVYLFGNNSNSQKQGKWKLIDIGLQEESDQFNKYDRKQINRKAIVQVWHRIYKQPKIRDFSEEQTIQQQYRGDIEQKSEYEFIIVTRNRCLRFTGTRNSLYLDKDRLIIMASTSRRSETLNKLTVSVYDAFQQKMIQTLTKNAQADTRQSIRVVNVHCQHQYQDSHRQHYEIIVSYSIGNPNTYITIFDFILLKSQRHSGSLGPGILSNQSGGKDNNNQKQESNIKVKSEISMQHMVNTLFVRRYSRYLYLFNSTHVSKISILTPCSTDIRNQGHGKTVQNQCVLYTQSLQLELGNQLIFSRNVGKYILLVYTHSYRILNLEGQFLQLVVDDHHFNNQPIQAHINNPDPHVHNQVSNFGVFDMIIFGSDTLLLGINNIIRSYDRTLAITIGPYQMRFSQIRTYRIIEIQAVAPQQAGQAEKMKQSFNLTVDYKTSVIQIRQNSIKMLENMPYQATNDTIIIFENMFYGPIEEYYINNKYTAQIDILNHIQKIFEYATSPNQSGQQPQGHDSGNPWKRQKQVGMNLPNNKSRRPHDQGQQMNRWIDRKTNEHIVNYNYYMLLRKDVNAPRNIQSIEQEKHEFIYCNNTHVIVVGLGCNGNGTILHEVLTNQSSTLEEETNRTYTQYCKIQETDTHIFVIYSKRSLLYICVNNSQIYSTQRVGTGKFYIRQLTITDLNNDRHNKVTTKQWVIILILKQASKVQVQDMRNTLAYVRLQIDKLTEIVVLGSMAYDVQYIDSVNGILVYVNNHPNIGDNGAHDRVHSQKPQRQLCIQPIQQLMNQSPNARFCTELQQVVPAKYYLSDISNYYKIVILSYQHQLTIADPSLPQQQLHTHSNTATLNSQTKLQKQQTVTIRYLMLSKFGSSYHLDLLAKIYITNQSNTHSGSPQQQSSSWVIRWGQVVNCYVSLIGYQAVNFIGVYINQTAYDYFILQFRELEDKPNSVRDSKKETILAFYRFNDEFNDYCAYVSAWVTAQQVANIIHIKDPSYYPIPHQSLMFTTDQIFHLLKNLSFILNYIQPPLTQYTIINAKNPLFYNKFYSKLIYEADPREKYFWIYCWVGFMAVGLVLLVLKIISYMIDKGYITWTKSLSSSDDDSGGSPGVTVHFSNSSGAMLTQQTSNKSSQIP